MAIVIIGVLVALSFYLGMRLFSANTENSALKANVASLKKRLAQR
jgi:hypothetical protein